MTSLGQGHTSVEWQRQVWLTPKLMRMEPLEAPAAADTHSCSQKLGVDLPPGLPLSRLPFPAGTACPVLLWSQHLGLLGSLTHHHPLGPGSPTPGCTDVPPKTLSPELLLDIWAHPIWHIPRAPNAAALSFPGPSSQQALLTLHLHPSSVLSGPLLSSL